ncbi:jerky protein homolog [Procambarus clarkii]|uniref:jerky protein homolog n=1 Tax=Procambarus clarkii TaxID=6728 RepID=UPI00374468D4
MSTPNARIVSVKASTSGLCNRKRSVMTFEKKVEIIKEVESGVPRSVMCAEYGISKSTVFDLLKAKPIIFYYFSRSESDKAIQNRKVVSKPKVESVDNAVWEWYKQRREVTKKPVAGWLLVEKAREFHQAMKITQKCVHSDGWLRSFKTHHGIRFIKVHGERQSADIVGADEYVSKFAEMVQEENLSLEQIYNADETGEGAPPEKCWSPAKSKVVLLLDNSSTHPRGDELVNGNIIGTFLPPNTTSVIQPMDQGIIKNLKHHYKRTFARHLNNQLGTLKDFYKVFTIKSAIWTIASAWDEVKQTTLRNGWKKTLAHVKSVS